MEGQPWTDKSGDERRARRADVNPVFANVGHITKLPAPQPTAEQQNKDEDRSFMSGPFRSVIPDYYQTNAISRASPTMTECSKVYSVPRAIAAE